MCLLFHRFRYYDHDVVTYQAAKKALGKQQQDNNNNKGDKRPLPQLPHHPHQQAVGVGGVLGVTRSHSAGQGQGLGQAPGQGLGYGLVTGSSMERSDYDSGVMDDDW